MLLKPNTQQKWMEDLMCARQQSRLWAHYNKQKRDQPEGGGKRGWLYRWTDIWMDGWMNEQTDIYGWVGG